MRSQTSYTGKGKPLAALLIATLVGLVASPATAQTSFSVQGGASIPAKHLADMSEPGAKVGADLSFWVSDQMALSVDGSLDMLPATDEGPVPATALPDLKLWHYGLGAKLDLVAADANPWSVVLKGGAGATTMDTDELAVAPTPEADFTETYLRVNGGLDIGYQASDNVKIAVGGGSYITFVDEEDMALFATMNPQVDPFDIAYTFPITAEVQIGLPN
jgi:hypothetical protein